MFVDQYLRGVLSRENISYGIAYSVRGRLLPILQNWAGGALVGLNPSGSFAKGTANKSGTDIDFLVSISPNCPNSLNEIYNSLYHCLDKAALCPRKQNVSLNVNIDGYNVDLVPARQQNYGSSDHSLYRRKANTWTKTNINTHIEYVQNSGRIDEIRLIKLWRNQKGLDFPSFYLEMAVIEALRDYNGSLRENVWRVFQYLHSNFVDAKFIDPANKNNIISDDLTLAEKRDIQNAAGRALNAKNWNEIIE